MMFGDEADPEQGRGQKYFVYGAVFVPTEKLRALHTEIENIRKAASLANTDSLKSASGTRPKGMTHEQHRELKSKVMTLARGCRQRNLLCASHASRFGAKSKA